MTKNGHKQWDKISISTQCAILLQDSLQTRSPHQSDNLYQVSITLHGILPEAYKSKCTSPPSPSFPSCPLRWAFRQSTLAMSKTPHSTFPTAMSSPLFSNHVPLLPLTTMTFSPKPQHLDPVRLLLITNLLLQKRIHRLVLRQRRRLHAGHRLRVTL